MKSADRHFLPVSERLIHTHSAVICIAFVLTMNYHHGIGKRLILPRLIFALKIVIKRLNEMNEFLEDAAAFFAASRQKSGKSKD